MVIGEIRSRGIRLKMASVSLAEIFARQISQTWAAWG
jgi:hypothetical protein